MDSRIRPKDVLSVLPLKVSGLGIADSKENIFETLIMYATMWLEVDFFKGYLVFSNKQQPQSDGRLAHLFRTCSNEKVFLESNTNKTKQHFPKQHFLFRRDTHDSQGMS